MTPDSTAAAPDGRAPALQLGGLHKQFGETTAVDHLDLDVPRVLPDNLALPERLTGRELT